MAQLNRFEVTLQLPDKDKLESVIVSGDNFIVANDGVYITCEGQNVAWYKHPYVATVIALEMYVKDKSDGKDNK